MSAVRVSRNEYVNTRLARNTGAKATVPASRYRNHGGLMSSDSGGSTNATASAMNRRPYSTPARWIRHRAFTRIARRTEARIAKKARALTSHVEPNSREKLTSDRV